MTRMLSTKNEGSVSALGRNDYPSPCVGCDRPCTHTKCIDWLIRYRYRQKQINGYAKKVGQFVKTKKREKFLYRHPDEAKRYLKTSPCDGCRATDTCDTPCGPYLVWYDAQVALARKRVGV